MHDITSTVTELYSAIECGIGDTILLIIIIIQFDSVFPMPFSKAVIHLWESSNSQNITTAQPLCVCMCTCVRACV